MKRFKPAAAVLICLTLTAVFVAGFLYAEGDDVDWAEGRFAGTEEEVRELMRLYAAIELTPEQEAIRHQALDDMPAPCCNNFSAATCCCECNLSRSLWGLAKHLITERGADAETVRKASESWIKVLNPDGFPGNTCSTGRCGLPFKEGGCGGMNAQHLVTG